ncbi:MAG: thioredoxin family protein [Sumerlaeia bacterium]
MTPEETALTQVLAQATGTVAVVLTDAFHPGAQTVAEQAEALTREIEDLEVIQLEIGRYREWAASHDAHGTPAVLVFRGGGRVRRVLGTVSSDRLREALASEAGP